MCGIFAMINPPGQKLDVPACRLATDMLEHRGPDDHGEWISGTNEVFLGHRRLTIIDLSDNSRQPMISDTGRVLIYNGEVYNFESIRRELRSLGCRFRSSGDTEVVLQALETWGTQCLTKMEGMFAFILWNPGDEQALIVRDFFGIKPLYFWISPNGSLVASSELKSLYAVPGFVPQLDHDALPEFLRFRSLSAGRTLLKGVRYVEPGQFLLFNRKSGELTQSTYWDPITSLSSPAHLSNSEHHEFSRIFKDTVQRHLIADVPVGIQFSGGVDSSLISAVVSKDLQTRLMGFHCQVKDPGHDESTFAREMAGFLNMDVQKVVLDNEIFFSDLLERLTWHHDEPINHANSVGIYLVSELAHTQVKALLSGEAADEFFAGYARYPLLLVQRTLGRLPGVPAAANILSRYATFQQGRIGKILNMLATSGDNPLETQIVEGLDHVDIADLTELLDDSHAREKSVQSRWLALSQDDSIDILTRCQVFDIQTYLPPILLRQDKMSMAASIESRVPFVTPTVFSVAMNLPTSERARLTSRKPFLKSRLAEYVPHRSVNRRKSGFGIPLNLWFQGPRGSERINSMVRPDSSLQGIVDIVKVNKLINGFDRDRQKADVLWTLLSLKTWLDVFGNRDSVLSFHRNR